MKLAVCLDDKNGMMFGKRRQSMDRLLRQDLLEMTAGATLWMSPYSAKQFTESADHIAVDADFLRKAAPEDWCFVEDSDIEEIASSVTKVAIYRWNRLYPADKRFPANLFSDRWTLESSKDFPGSSHEKITLEVYAL